MNTDWVNSDEFRDILDDHTANDTDKLHGSANNFRSRYLAYVMRMLAATEGERGTPGYKIKDNAKRAVNQSTLDGMPRSRELEGNAKEIIGAKDLILNWGKLHDSLQEANHPVLQHVDIKQIPHGLAADRIVEEFYQRRAKDYAERGQDVPPMFDPKNGHRLVLNQHNAIFNDADDERAKAFIASLPEAKHHKEQMKRLRTILKDYINVPRDGQKLKDIERITSGNEKEPALFEGLTPKEALTHIGNAFIRRAMAADPNHPMKGLYRKDVNTGEQMKPIHHYKRIYRASSDVLRMAREYRESNAKLMKAKAPKNGAFVRGKFVEGGKYIATTLLGGSPVGAKPKSGRLRRALKMLGKLKYAANEPLPHPLNANDFAAAKPTFREYGGSGTFPTFTAHTDAGHKFFAKSFNEVKNPSFGTPEQHRIANLARLHREQIANEAAQLLGGHDTHIPSFVAEHKGRTHIVSPFVENYDMMMHVGRKDKGQMRQMLNQQEPGRLGRILATDFLMGDADAHDGNYGFKDGKLMRHDYGEALRDDDMAYYPGLLREMIHGNIEDHHFKIPQEWVKKASGLRGQIKDRISRLAGLVGKGKSELIQRKFIERLERLEKLAENGDVDVRDLWPGEKKK